jgi:hypothetical protein
MQPYQGAIANQIAPSLLYFPAPNTLVKLEGDHQLAPLKYLSVTQNSLQALPPSLLRSRELEKAIIWMNPFSEAYIHAVHEQVSFRFRN